LDETADVMKLTCNIDQRGRRVRMIGGLMTDSIGTVLLVAGILMERGELIGPGVVLILAGGFMVFEAVAGWCALRALGFKTKL
jgi:hypothetical protein